MVYAPQNYLLNIFCQGDAGCLVWNIDGLTNIIEMNVRHQIKRDSLRFKERMREGNIKEITKIKFKKKTVWKRRNNGRSVPTSRTEPLFTPNSPVTFCSVTSIPARALFLVAFCERWDEALVYPDKDAFCSLPEVNHVSTITRVGI